MTIGVQQRQDVTRVLVITLVLNVLVAIGKIVLGLVTGALAITADGFHSITDGAGNVAGLVAIRVSSNPPDDNHPYGHTKFETVGALMIGVLLFISAWEVITSVLERLNTGEKPLINSVTLVMLLMTLVINVAVSRYQIAQGKHLRSTILLADAKNTASDVWVTTSVLVSSILVGITGWAWLDAVSALIVVALILRAGVQIITQTGRVLVDTAPYSPDELIPYVSNIPQIQSVVRVRSRGTTESSFIDVDVRVDPNTTVRETNTIADHIRLVLNTHLEGVEEVEVHFEAV